MHSGLPDSPSVLPSVPWQPRVRAARHDVRDGAAVAVLAVALGHLVLGHALERTEEKIKGLNTENSLPG